MHKSSLRGKFKWPRTVYPIAYFLPINIHAKKRNLFRQFFNLFLEAKQNKLHNQLPNGHATLIGNNSNLSQCNAKVPPRPPIRSTTTTTTPLSVLQQQQHQQLQSIEMNTTGTNTMTSDSPNLKFVLAQTMNEIPQAAMDEMRVW